MSERQHSYTYTEIMSQGETWAETLAKRPAVEREMGDFLRQPYAETLIVGCGSTHYLSLASAAVWQALTKRRAAGRPASELWLLPESSMPSAPSLLVAVSRSGYTTETLRAIEQYRRAGGQDVLAVTCYPEKPMAGTTPYVLAAEHAGEESVAQTRSFSNMYMLTQIAAGIAADHPAYLDSLAVLPGAFDRLVRGYEGLAQALGENHRLDRLVYLGSGHNYGLASEGMLKMKEMSLSSSEVFHFLEFRHGPKSVVTPGTLVIGLIHDAIREQENKVLVEMKELGATTLAIAETAEGISADYVVELKSGLNSLAGAVLQLPFLQLLAYYRSISKGLNPDRPLNLTAVVEL